MFGRILWKKSLPGKCLHQHTDVLMPKKNLNLFLRKEESAETFVFNSSGKFVLVIQWLDDKCCFFWCISAQMYLPSQFWFYRPFTCLFRGRGGGVILVSVFRFSDTAFEMLSSRCRPALMRKRANPVHW